MTSKTVLFVSHKKTHCGVYEYGENVFDAIKSSKKYDFIKAECSSLEELKAHVAKENPIAIIYNYMPDTMPWIANARVKGLFLENNIADIPVLQIGIIHSIMQDIADSAVQARPYTKFHPELANRIFDFYIAPDPTLLLMNNLVYKQGRPIPGYLNKFPQPEKLIIGSFGFQKTGFEDLIRLVQKEFDEAEIRLSIPFANFGDEDGSAAKQIADNCKQLIKKPGITLSVSHDYLDKNALLDFLAQNTINVFLRDNTGRGISSVIDYALAVDRPIAISDSQMFRHILNTQPSIRVSCTPLKEIIKNGTAPLKAYQEEWSGENLRWEYERILDSALNRLDLSPRLSTVRIVKHALRVILERTGLLKPHDTSNRISFLKTTEYYCEDNYTSILDNASYNPIPAGAIKTFNGILNDIARELYKPTVQHLFELVPKTMAKKISVANVQQAFVFDTVYRHLKDYKNPKLLCVGSYEDTACMGLIKMGIAVEEVDPTLNYFLQEYATKPGVIKGSYNIIFSTSVIEHDPDDKSFVESVSALLAPGGIFVMTCDYKDDWRQGDPKPGVCARLYTKADMESRLLSYMDNCQLIDKPDWECPEPDFDGGVCKYSFASFVAKKGIV